MRKIAVFFIFLLLQSASYSFSQQFIVKGIVTDPSNKPMAAVSVFNTKATRGTITNDLGEFSITLDSFPATILFSYVGYDTDTVDITFAISNIHIVLKPLENQLAEVIVGNEAGIIIANAVEKGYRNRNNIQYAKALYRQFDKEGGRLTTFKEILMKIKWFPGAICKIRSH